jgi:hypothetical protein
MMNIRALEPKDMEELNRLHDKFFSEQFSKTDFTKGFLSAFVIADDDGKTVMGGGIRPIAETIIVTDKEANPHLLGDALLEALRFSQYTCARYNIELLHAFVKDPVYAKHLVKHGFSKRESTAYYMGV